MKLDRSTFGFEVKLAAADAEAGTFAGYGAVFDNLDYQRDVIVKGAFRETLREWKKRGKWPKMLSQHGGWSPDDMLPIGQWTSMAEDDKGLYCAGKLFALDTERGRYLHEGLKSGELDGLSIGYEVKSFDFGTKPEEPRRTLKKIALWEVSVVTFGANDQALIDQVKSAADIKTIREFEEFLRDVGRFSRAAAKAIASRGFQPDPEPRDEDGELASLMASLAKAIAVASQLSSKG
jgi:hypothetical protein